MIKKRKKTQLDDYENEILEAYESGNLKPLKSQENYQEIASNTLKKIKKSTLEFLKMILQLYRERPREKVFRIKP